MKKDLFRSLIKRIPIVTLILFLLLVNSVYTAHAATITVTNLNDSGAGSLRQAVIDAAPGDTINFGINGTITLTSGAIYVGKDLTISGPGAGSLTINGNNTSRIFSLSLSTVTISGMTLTNGRSNGGAAIDASGTLTINDTTITNNTSTDNRGSILHQYAPGELILNNSTISGNIGGGVNGGEGVYSITLNNSTISGNSITGNGGGINMYAWDLHLNRSIVSGNTATGSGNEIYAEGVFDGRWCGPDPIIFGNNYNVLGHSGANGIVLGDCTTDFTGGSDITPAGALTTILDTTLADNGGSTFTHALVSGSPAIDIAPTANCAASPINGRDQRGATRSTDGNGDNTVACDAGAVEMGQLQCGIQSNSEPTTYPFLSNSVAIEITNDGSNLDCLRVTDIPWNHPNATSGGSGLALMTGKYWIIDGLQADGSTEATTGYGFDLTLPFSSADDSSRACKWLEGAGPGYGWDCGNDGDNTPALGVSVTRTGLNSFSDWAVGDSVGPTAVTLQSISATSNTAILPIVLIAALLLALMGGIVLRRRSG